MIEIEKNERILQVIHRHWFILLGHIFFLLVTLALPVIALVLFQMVPVGTMFAWSGDTFHAGGFFLFAWLTIVWMIGWKIWTTYYLDTIIVTDKRIFDIDQRGLFSRQSGSFRIDRIQNITVNQKGIIQTLLDFGTVEFETAGGNAEDFVAEYVARPYLLKKLINQMQDGTLDKTQEVHLHSDSLERLAVLQHDPDDASANPETAQSTQSYRGGKLDDREGI
jgi:uncharacterized membrane protein YdbT with pleckstrin-like domain